jgi:hypothetical protein
LPLLQPQASDREPPLMFVEVNPVAATAEPPKNPRFYSDRNSVAANPDPDQDTGTPKINGTQEHEIKTETVPRSEPFPLNPVRPQPVVAQPEPPQRSPEPAPQPPPPLPVPQPPAPAPAEAKPKPAQPLGDLAMAKPGPDPRNDNGRAEAAQPPQPAPPPKPRTIEEAMRRLADNNQLPGEAMRQPGGVGRRLEISSLDTKATLTGAYDWELVQAVKRHWYALLDERRYTSDERGKVAIKFRLHYDGKVTGVAISESTTSEVLAYLCVRAIEDPAPYRAWPKEMRLEISNGTRDVTFTFWYD